VCRLTRSLEREQPTLSNTANHTAVAIMQNGLPHASKCLISASRWSSILVLR
jgi:hypothetical protein